MRLSIVRHHGNKDDSDRALVVDEGEGYGLRYPTRTSRMAIDAKLLEILACPLCKTDLKLTADEQGLKCVKCHRVYPIKDDIPVMLIDEATVEPDRATKD